MKVKQTQGFPIWHTQIHPKGFKTWFQQQDCFLRFFWVAPFGLLGDSSLVESTKGLNQPNQETPNDQPTNQGFETKDASTNQRCFLFASLLIVDGFLKRSMLGFRGKHISPEITDFSFWLQKSKLQLGDNKQRVTFAHDNHHTTCGIYFGRKNHVRNSQPHYR